MKDPIEELMDEHRTIEQVLAALETAAQRDVPISFYERAVDFITHFADGCHHDKEEALLFPALEAHGVPKGGGPIAVMLHEHDVGRACVARLREAIAAGDVAAARDAARDYTDLLHPHIAKEDGVLYEIARRVLPKQEIEALATRFEAVDESRGDAARYRELAARLLAEASKEADS
jgi:hemerythrin-like domain-containing protein